MKRIALAAALVLAPLAPAYAEDEAALEGLWTFHANFGPDLGGELDIARTAAGWRAVVGEATSEGPASDLVFGERGRFRGALAPDGKLEGWWIQPPGLPGQAYATPVRFAAAGRNAWRGEAAPLPQTFTLHLRILHGEDGRWLAAFRNPEFNLNGGASRFVVRRSGNDIAFLAGDGSVARAATFDGARLTLDWPPVPAPLVLARTTAATGYLAREPGVYRYASPPRLADGWRTAAAHRVALDEAALAALVQRIADADPAAQRPQLVHSLLVARHGRLALEEYFHGYDRDTPHDIRSAGKTFASVLLGAVMREGRALSPDTRIAPLMGGAGTDPRKNEITLAHLMTHTSGLACDDNDDASPGGEGAMQGQSDQPDWWRFTIDLPMAHEPGARYAYCTGGMNLVGAALRQATGETIPALFDRLVARPLQFGRYHWNLMPNGEGYLGGGAYLRPRDLLKVGQMYLHGGVWRGRRIVSRDWVETSTAAHVEINETTTGMDAERFANVALRGTDGYAWHRNGVRSGGRRIETYEANGNGGQFLIVVPEYDLVVVMTGGAYGQGGIWNRWRDEIAGAVVAAARSR